MNMETTTMQLIINSGEVRSKSMEAIGSAKSGDFNRADEILNEADGALAEAHRFQTDMIQKEAAGDIDKVTLLMAHAQDHLMCAITVLDLAREFVELYKSIHHAS